MLLPVGASPPLLWRAGRGLLSFPCLGHAWAALRVVWVGALPCWGVFGWFPFTCGWAVISALRAAREHTLCGVWLPGVVALVAYAVSGHPVTVLDAGAVAGFPCFWWGVLLRALWCVRATVCLSVAPCPVACCWFVAVCFVCRLLCGCAFRECSRTACDVVHAGLCECAFDGNRDCRLFFTV